MITREQVADLQPGDVVEFVSEEWPNGVTLRGPLGDRYGNGGLWLGDKLIRFPDGDVTAGDAKYSHLTVVSRAPRPLYVNHPRTEPVYGDVVLDADNPNSADTWRYSDDDAAPWLGFRANEDNDRREWDWFDRDELPDRLRLLVDGETGQVVQ